MRWKLGVALWLPLNLACSKPVQERNRELGVTFLSVGQGDCAVLQVGSEAILVDAGPRSPGRNGSPGFDAGERVVLKRLRELGVARLRGVFLSHDDLDHIGGATALLRAFAGATAWTGPESRIPVSPRVAQLEAEGRMAFGPFRIAWRFPQASGNEDNARSALMLVEAEGMRFAFTGDSPSGVEEGVSSLANGTVDVYRVGHHGSRTSSSAALLKALRPRFAVVSCGAGNRFGHPHPLVLDRLKAAGAKVFRTDRDGDVAFRFRGGAWTVAATPLDPALR